MKRKSAIDPGAVRAATKVGVMLTPEQIAASGTEHAHQAAVMQWVAIHGRAYQNMDLLFAIPNGGDRRASVAASLKAEGVKSGVPDLMLPIPAGPYPGLWIEMKVPEKWGTTNGGRSDAQIKWHKRLRAQGYAVATCYSWTAAVTVLSSYYRGDLEMPANGDCLFVPSVDAPKPSFGGPVGGDAHEVGYSNESLEGDDYGFGSA